MSDREFDVVVYGASGFTGKLVVDYLLATYGSEGDLKWAIAGRNLDKLEQVKTELGAPASLAVLQADSADEQSVTEMAARTKVILTTVGPYQKYGSTIVAACAKEGTDYVDLCGEPLWMRQMVDAHQKTAESTGARIVFSCGFDSIPFEFGIYYLQELAWKKLGAPLPRVRGRVRGLAGSASGGTLASWGATTEAVNNDPALMELFMNPFVLTPGFTGPEQPSGEDVAYEEDIDSWVSPFLMAPINVRNIHRSNLLLNHRWSKDFVYDEMLMTGPGEEGEKAAKAPDNIIPEDNLPKPGEGPSRAEREAGSYDILFVGDAADGQQMRASVAGDLDPGYGSTSRMISEAAVCLAKDTIPAKGGIWTPGSAMPEALLPRLINNAGLRFSEES